MRPTYAGGKQPMNAMSEALQQTIETIEEVRNRGSYALVLQKLDQFRRHPDWRRAMDRVRKTRREFFTVMGEGEFEGRWGIRDEDVSAYIDAVDQEFIDEIIRNGG
jgi:hypothetical protein